MPDSADPPKPSVGVDRAARWVRRWLVGLLLCAYALATVAPGPGLWLREFQIVSAGGPAPVKLSLLLVGVLLVCGAFTIDVARLRELSQRPIALVVGLLGCWAPAVVVVMAWRAAASWLVPMDQAEALVLGLTLAAAMPVANSAVAWSQQSGGSLVWALGLVVISISLCPWVAPIVFAMNGLGDTAGAADPASGLVVRLTGAVFLIWVLGPTLLGMALRGAVGGERADAARPWATLASAAALLLLNYANASVALPSVIREPDPKLLFVAVAVAASLPLVTALPAGWLAALCGLERDGRQAWRFSLAMKNTGLALGLAGSTIGDRPVALLVILAVTLTQHLIAGAMHAIFAPRADASYGSDS